MSQPFRHRVNYCLQQAERALAADTELPARETALFFLYRAYLLYLRELAHGLTLPDGHWVSAANLADGLQARGAHADSVDECLRLERSGFLAELERAWQMLLFPAVHAGQPPEARTEVLGSDRMAALSHGLPALQHLHEALTVLIERQRQMGAEY